MDWLPADGKEEAITRSEREDKNHENINNLSQT